MANFFIKRPIFAIVVALVITIAGALCIFSLPIDRSEDHAAAGLCPCDLSGR